MASNQQQTTNNKQQDNSHSETLLLTTNNKIGVIGCGAMGSGIAQVAATAGHHVVIYDNNQPAIEKAEINLKNSLKKLVEKQKLTEHSAKEIISRITYSSTLNAFSSCDLIIEAIVENLQIKQELFSELETVVSENCILASNTSSLSIASIASACKKNERVLGIHFFNPPTLMPLVEIIPAITTNPQLIQPIKMLMTVWGKIPVIAKDTPGFIVNRVARSYYGEAIRIYEEGIADFATIDWAMKNIGKFKMGPFELMDFIGNDINYKVTESVWEQFFYEPRFKPSLTQKRLYEAKLFGRKTGKGYYDYNENAQLPKPIENEELGKLIFYRIISMLINEAVDALYLGLATKEDIDSAMTKGVNYPKGLLQWVDELGLVHILDILDKLYTEYQEDRYRPSVLLKRMVKDNANFYNKNSNVKFV